MKPTTLRIRITVRGRLSERLATAFDDVTLVRRRGATELVGEVVDQAQLYGLLARIRDLGLDLESLHVVSTHAPETRTQPFAHAARRQARAAERS